LNLSKLKQYFKLESMLSVFKWVVIIYALFTIGSFLIVLIDKVPTPMVSASGLVGFFIIFEYPIKITTGLIALLAILLTAMRMEQTQKQIDILDDNNRFNNFYKHREEFEKAFKEFPLLKSLIQYEQYHQKNRRIAIDEKAQLLGNKLVSSAKVFYADWYYKDYTKFSTNFNPDIMRKINNINKVLNSLPITVKENGNKEINFERTSDENLNNIIKEYPSSITIFTTHFTLIDKLELLADRKTVSDYSYFQKLNIVYWGLLFFSQLMNNQGMNTTEIYNFITHYNTIRIKNELFNI
jgi:hypothetical protein